MVQIEITPIEQLFVSYAAALKAGDVPGILKLYSNDGVFMPTNAETAIGQDQLRTAYEGIFKAIRLDIKVHVDEIMPSEDYAFVRTTSKGTTLIHASSETVIEENRELFVLQQQDGVWKIARYMFNKMK